MSALRITAPLPASRPTGRLVGSSRALAFALCAVLCGITGCGEQRADNSADPHPYRANMTTPLPPPATDKIEYDDKTRTLTFYDLHGPGRWMVQVGGAIYPVGPDHRLPEGINPDETYVCYTRPGGQTSGHVSLRQIQAARQMHQSR